ncbi:MATE family efflux transporter [Paenibacillus sp. PK3_47]|nr:MATE family efflux transporter [Paenibacillus sp. PK3_47]
MTTQNTKRLTLFGLTWPIFIELSLQMLMGNADTLMLSQYSDHSVAAVGAANRLIYIVILFYGVIATGVSVLVARHLGAGEHLQASESAAIAVSVNLLIGLGFSVMMLVCGQDLLHVMGLPGELYNEAMPYVIWVGGFSFVTAVSLVLSAVLRSHGHTRDIMFVTFGMNLLDLIGNYLFIFGPFGIPVLGVTGVAVTTTISKTLGLIVLLFLIRRHVRHPLPFSRLFRLPRVHLRNLLQIGIPSAAELMSYHTSQLAVTIIASTLGTAVLTAKVYTENLMMIIYLFSMAIGQGTQILAGHLAGAGLLQDIYKRCLRSVGISFGVSAITAVLIFVYSWPLFSLFTDNTGIIRTGRTLLFITIFLEPGRSLNLVILGALRALGDIKFAVYLGIVSMWGIGVGLAYFLAIPLGLGLAGVWIAFAIDEWLRGIVLLQRWNRRVWQQRSKRKNSASGSAIFTSGSKG